jgi:ribosomal protein S18 acetylase RimI-like enzyme
MVVDRSSEQTLHSRSYLIMKANTEAALRLAEESWVTKSTPSYVNTRQLTAEDTPEFVELYNRCFIASPDPFCLLSIEDAKNLDREGIFVAEIWGTMGGFIACFVQKGDSSIYGEITGIGVLPSRRRKGVATVLVKRAARYFIESGCEEIYCEVYEGNHPSQMLILSYGFEEVGRREIQSAKGDTDEQKQQQMPGGKIMRRLGLRPRAGCDDCRDI